MFEITVDGVAYPLRFGMGFLREINRTVQTPVDGAPGVKNSVGLRHVAGRLIDGQVEALLEVIYLANKTESPRLTMQALEAWVEDEGTDIDEEFDRVMDFLRTANATKKEVRLLEEVVAKSLAAAEE